MEEDFFTGIGVSFHVVQFTKIVNNEFRWIIIFLIANKLKTR